MFFKALVLAQDGVVTANEILIDNVISPCPAARQETWPMLAKRRRRLAGPADN